MLYSYVIIITVVLSSSPSPPQLHVWRLHCQMEGNLLRTDIKVLS